MRYINNVLPISSTHSRSVKVVMSTKIFEERCVVLLGKSGAGKSTVANQLAEHDPMSSKDPPFKVSTQVLQSVTRDVSHTDRIFTREDVQYKVTVIDTVGLFDTKALGHDDLFDKIEEYFNNHIKGVNIILFVFRQGRMTEEEIKVFSFVESRLTKEFSPISALAITGCENMDDEARKALINEFEGDQETKRIASQMGKGIYPVGFPNIKTLRPVLREAYKPQMDKDRDTLLDLVFHAKKLHLTKQLFLEKVKPAAQEAYDAINPTNESSSSSWSCNIF